MSADRELPWFPTYVDDWMTSEVVLTLDDSAYRCYHWLLCHQWKKGSLPDSVPQLAAMCGKDVRTFRKAWTYLESVFPVDYTGRRKNTRLHAEREKQEEKRRQLAANRFGKGKKQTTFDNQTLFNSLPENISNDNQMGGSNDNHSREELRSTYKASISRESVSSETRNGHMPAALQFGGGPAPGTGPVAFVLRDDDDRQEWVSVQGEHWVRVDGVTDSRGEWAGEKA